MSDIKSNSETVTGNRAGLIAGAVVAALLIIAIIVWCVMGFAGSTPEKKTISVATNPAKVLADNVPVTSVVLNRGDRVKVLEEKGDYYLVELLDAETSSRVIANGEGPATVYVNKTYVRRATDAVLAEKTAYATATVQVFSSAFLEGAALAELKQNDAVTILDSFGDCVYLRLEDGTKGYATIHGFADEPIVTATAAVASGGSSGYYSGGDGGWSGDSGGSSSGGSSGAAEAVPPAESEGADGGDIDLGQVAYHPAFPVGAGWGLVETAYADEATDIILTDDLQSYLGWFKRGDALDVADLSAADGDAVKAVPADMKNVPAGKTLVVVRSQWGYVSDNLVRLNSATPYASWTGFTEKGAALFPLYQLEGEALICDRNQSVTILDDLGTCYVAQVGDTVGYVGKDQVSKTEYEEPTAVAAAGANNGGYGYDYSDYSGGGWSGGSDDGGNYDVGGASSSEVIESAVGGWTDEVL